MTEFTDVVRVVMPLSRDDEEMPLYLDAGRKKPWRDEMEIARSRRRQEPIRPEQPPSLGHLVRSRRSVTIPATQRISFGTLMNAFPASYWRHWTSVDSVRLSVRISGTGTVIVYKSNYRGMPERVDSAHIADALVGDEGHGDTAVPGPDGSTQLSFDLSLTSFSDGGWYWFDIVGGEQGAVLEEASWQVAQAPVRPGRISIGTTTFNRPEMCAQTLIRVGGAPELDDIVDTFYVVDQGTQHVADDPEFERAQQLLGDRLQLIYQDNLGGSGGFARGMLESITAGTAAYHLVLDDDILVEPESIRRAAIFASYCRRPTLVGGEMAYLEARGTLHNLGEVIDQRRWRWRTAGGLPQGHDLTVSNLRETMWLHQRTDVDYNGWWFTLIPTEVIRSIGLSMPLFIKWDDAEYGLRAQRAGFPTVTLPGVCIWSLAWGDKDDTIDWQAYYYQRNKLVTALVHAAKRNLPWLMLDDFSRDVMHGISSQYYAQAARIKALQDVLRGPEHLHQALGSTLPELRAMKSQYTDAQYKPDAQDLPAVVPQPRLLPRRPASAYAPTKWAIPPLAAFETVRHLLPVPKAARNNPTVRVPGQLAKYWQLARVDSALVTKSDGSGVAWYRRDPGTFAGQIATEEQLRAELLRRWDELAGDYQAAFSDLVSPRQWAQTFGIDPAAEAKDDHTKETAESS